MKTFKQYYLNEAYYQILDEDLDNIVNYIYNRFKELINKNKQAFFNKLFGRNRQDSINFDSLWEYNIRDKKPRLIRISNEINNIRENKIKFVLRLFFINGGSEYFTIRGYCNPGMIGIDLYLSSDYNINFFYRDKNKIKLEIRDTFIHENTHAFDNIVLKDKLDKIYGKLSKFKLEYGMSDSLYCSSILKTYRSDMETNAMIHQLIYLYKRLQKQNYPGLENISLFDLVDKNDHSLVFNFVLSSSTKLQKDYIRRLNREGIPISRIGKPKHTFEEYRNEIIRNRQT
jgi:hypothetical protein